MNEAMNWMDFSDHLMDEIMDRMPDEIRRGMTLGCRDVTKMNDVTLHGIAIREEGSNAEPVFYVDEFLSRYRQGEPMGRLADEIASQYLSVRDGIGEVKAPQISADDLSYDKVKDKLSLRLLEVKRNREFLRNVPYLAVGNGLALVADIRISEEVDGQSRTTVTWDLLNNWGISGQELFQDAITHTEIAEPPKLLNMERYLMGGDRTDLLTQPDPETGNILVLTNEDGLFGSAALFYPGVKEKIADVLGEGYSVLPSSVHEVIVVPDSLGMDAETLTQMVKEVNSVMVSPGERLSDRVLHFDERDRSLTPALPEKSARDTEMRC